MRTVRLRWLLACLLVATLAAFKARAAEAVDPSADAGRPPCVL